MPGPTNFNPPFAVLDPQYSAPGLAAISPNVRAFTAQGPIATQADVIVFPYPLQLPPPLLVLQVGTWTIANRRTYVNGVATVSQSSNGVGVLIPAGTPTGTIYSTAGASRVHTR